MAKDVKKRKFVVVNVPTCIGKNEYGVHCVMPDLKLIKGLGGISKMYNTDLTRCTVTIEVED